MLEFALLKFMRRYSIPMKLQIEVFFRDSVEDVSGLGLEDSVEVGFVAGVEDGLVEGSIVE